MLERFERLPRAARAPVIVLLVLGLGWLDYATGYRISFAFFYLLPVALGAWSLGPRSGLALSVGSAAVWLSANQLAGDPAEGPALLIWNSGTRFGFFVVVTLLLSRLRASLERERALSRTDFLTGTLNSRAFGELAATELARARRYRRPFSVLYLDLDNFKTVNDELGHTTGDRLLRTVAEVVRDSLRRTDTIARMGGDEFAVLMPETGADAARAAAENVRVRVLEAMRADAWPVTLSIGALTCVTPPPTVDALITRADALMYQIKHATKDGVAAATYDLAPEPARLARRG